jgi:hypothetical protein
MKMKPDDFENQLQRRPMRPVPGEWRAEILAAAQAARSIPAIKNQKSKTENSWLAVLLWPSPKAWAGLAAVWVVIAFLVHAGGDDSDTLIAQAAPPSPQLQLVLREQRRELARLLESPEPLSAEPPKPFIPRPHGELKPQITLI